jgi:hypothetical protein
VTEQVLVHQAASACSTAADAAAAVREVIEGFGAVDAGAVVFFASPALDGDAVRAGLAGRFPGVPVVGCTTAGEFTQARTTTGGLSAVALPRDVVRRSAVALADLGGGVAAGIRSAVGEIEQRLGSPLRDLDPARYVGIALIDGMHGDEEEVNEALGNAAPLMSFVGGSAGDDLAFRQTLVSVGTTASTHGAALLVLELAVPFAVVKTCSFEEAGRSFTITRADASQRVVWELDGRPAAEAYADAVGLAAGAEIDSSAFMSHPLGLMIDGRPWIRSPQQVVPGGGIKFYCQILEGMTVELMRSTDLVAETRAAMRAAAEEVGGEVSGAVMFNCILRRLEIDAKQAQQPFVDAVAALGAPSAGFHTYGESWLGHMNQTLTAIVFGRAATH